MKRIFEIHDENGVFISGEESDVSKAWMYLTKPVEISSRLLTKEDIKEIVTRAPDREINGQLRLLRQLSVYEK